MGQGGSKGDKGLEERQVGGLWWSHGVRWVGGMGVSKGKGT
jgi:hypothetical protein